MKRILTIAQSEFLTLVKTKAFIIGIFLMPVLMVGVLHVHELRRAAHVDTTDRRVRRDRRDRRALRRRSRRRPRSTTQEPARATAQTGPHFLPKRVDPAAAPATTSTVELSRRRCATKELFAFVEIPADVLDAESEADRSATTAENTVVRDGCRDWLRTTLQRRDRESAGSTRRASIARWSSKLTARADADDVRPGRARGRRHGRRRPRKWTSSRAFGVPIFFLILMFMAVMTSAQHLLNAIIEEKMSKISEVLLGSVTPFQLLAGKLLGVVGVSFLLTLVYLAGGIYALMSFGRPDLIDPGADRLVPASS